MGDCTLWLRFYYSERQVLYMISRFNTWRKQHKIEFFGATVLLLLVTLCADLFGTLFYAANADHDYLTGASFYSPGFVTSLSGVDGNIVDVYVNEDHSKCGIMVYLNDMLSVSTNALDYELFVRDINVSKGTYMRQNLNNPNGGYYVFGSTGYAMIYLVNTGGFKERAIEVIVRSNNLVTEQDAASSDNAEAMLALKEQNSTFSQYDQYRIIVNPSATGAHVVDFLDDMDIEAAYRYCVLDQQEKGVRQTLALDVAALNDGMRKINQYTSDLMALGVRVPKLPECIYGDKFTDDDKVLPVTIVDERAGTSTDMTCPAYMADYVFNGGVEFDWQHQLLGDGIDFFDGLMKSGQTKQQFLRNLALSNTTQDTGTIDISELTMIDGTPLNYDMAESTRQDDMSIFTAAQAYVETVDKYMTTKKQYQTVDLVAYLTLQYNMEVSGQSFTSNLVDGVVTVWGQ